MTLVIEVNLTQDFFFDFTPKVSNSSLEARQVETLKTSKLCSFDKAKLSDFGVVNDISSNFDSINRLISLTQRDLQAFNFNTHCSSTKIPQPFYFLKISENKVNSGWNPRFLSGDFSTDINGVNVRVNNVLLCETKNLP